MVQSFSSVLRHRFNYYYVSISDLEINKYYLISDYLFGENENSVWFGCLNHIAKIKRQF